MIERTVFEYLVNVLWQLPLLLFGVWLLVRVARPSLLAQHLLWLATLAFAIVLPLRGVVLSKEAAPSGVAAALTPAAYIEPEFTPIPVNKITTDALDTAPATAPQSPGYFAMRTGSITVSAQIMHWAVRLYLLLLAFSALRLMISLIAALRIRARSIVQPLTLFESSLLITCARRIHLPI